MRASVALTALFALAFGAAPVAYAQRGMGRAWTGRVHPSRPAAVRTGGVRRTAAISTVSPAAAGASNFTPATTGAFSTFAPLTVADLLNPVPGFGFDFNHLAAINQDLDIRALIDPVTQMRLALAERLLRETPPAAIGFPLFFPDTSMTVEQPPAPPAPAQAPIIIVQLPPGTATPQASAAAPPEAAAAPESSAPLPDIGAFILVLRNGSQLSAAAFSRQGDNLVYVTPEGIRRTLALASLDLDATQRANEDRGSSFNLSQP